MNHPIRRLEVSNLIKKKSKMTVQIKFDNKTEDNYFHLTPTDKQNHILDRIRNLEQTFLRYAQLSYFQPLNYVSENSFYTYGCLTSMNGDVISKENAYFFNVYDNVPVFVKLNLDLVKSFCIYNGLVCMAKVKIYKDNKLQVEELITFSSFERSRTYMKELNLEGVILKGPIESNTLSKIMDKTFNFLIIFGPFIKNDSFDQFIELIENEVIAKNNQIKVVLVPSLKDVAFFNVLPQPPLNLNNDQIICVSNPSIIEINEKIQIALVNYDVFKELNDNCLVHPNKEINFDNLCYYILNQNSFVPVLPSKYPINYQSNLNIDKSINLFITSSDLPFEKSKIESCQCTFINISKDDQYLTIKGNQKIIDVDSVYINK